MFAGCRKETEIEIGRKDVRRLRRLQLKREGSAFPGRTGSRVACERAARD